MTRFNVRTARGAVALPAAILAAVVLASCSDDDDDNTVTPPAIDFSHAAHFNENPYVGPNMNTACVGCHAQEVQALLQTGHWNWSGEIANVVGVEGEVHGKVDFLNNFCIAVPTNEGRCTQCHVGTGWDDYGTYDHSDPAGVDCLVCHDTTGTYAKGKTTAGMPMPGLDWQAIAGGIGMPDRVNCGTCHYKAGGGDNVKHGDLAINLNNTTREYDVHMGTDGANMNCVDCHGPDENHGLGGMPFHSVSEGNMASCTDCHDAPHEPGSAAYVLLAIHPTLSCEACHIPAIARFRTTKTEWYWHEAGDLTRTPVDVGDGRFDYDPKKGEFVWDSNVRTTFRRHDGTWNRMIIGVNDTYTGRPTPADPVVLAEPAAPKDPAAAGSTKIYPFKKMIGTQVADTANNRIMVPHLFGMKGGPNPYWVRYDWDLALQDASAKLGIPYSGTHGFVDTVMYLTVNHEVAPKEMALGAGGCYDCHGNDPNGDPLVDWSELGRSEDPLN